MKMKRSFSLSFFLSLALLMLWAGNISAANSSSQKYIASEEKPKARILFVGSSLPKTPVVHPKYKEELEKMGYWVEASTLEEFTRDKRLEYNVIVLTTILDLRKKDPFFSKERQEMLINFLKKGGGILLIPTFVSHGNQDKLIKDINRFLKQLGAELLFKEKVEGKNKIKKTYLLDYFFFSTTNISRHPVTEGVNILWLPVGLRPIPGAGVYTMKVNNKWDIIVRAGKDVSTATYPSEPPIIAARKYAKGRIVLFSCDAHFWVNDVFHPAFKGFLLKNGDGWRLFKNIYDWLAEPSIKEGYIYKKPKRVRVTKEERPRVSKKSITPYREIFEVTTPKFHNVYKGVIGVHSTLSSGENTVREYSALAKKLGYNFLVFTEDYYSMNKTKWEQLVKECEEVSSQDFVAIPGIEIRDPERGYLISFAITKFPRYPLPYTDGTLSWAPWFKLLYHTRGGANWPNVSLIFPDLHKLSPFQKKFYNGIALFSYEGNKLKDRAINTYRDLITTDYRLIPITYHQIKNLKSLTQLKGALTYARGNSVKDIESSLITTWKAGYSFVSSGPLIKKFRVAYDNKVKEAGENASPDVGAQMLFQIEVSSGLPIKEVTLYRNREIYKRFFPGERYFSKIVRAINDQDGAFTLYVVDSEGREAISNPIMVKNPVFFFLLATDKQNTYIHYHDPKTGKKMFGNGFMMAHYAGIATIWKPVYEVLPSYGDYWHHAINVFDTQAIFHTQQGILRCKIPERKLKISSFDAIVVDNYYYEYERDIAKTQVRYTYFRPYIGSLNLRVIEMETTVEKDILLARDARHNLEDLDVELMRLNASKGIALYRNYSYLAPDGNKYSGQFTESFIKRIKEKISKSSSLSSSTPRYQDQYFPIIPVKSLRRKGYVALWPHQAGSFAVYPLDQQEYYFSTGITIDPTHSFYKGYRKYGNYLSIGLRISNKKIRAGTEWRNRFLFVMDNGESNKDTIFDYIYDKYGFNQKASIFKPKLIHGNIIDSTGFLDLEAKNYYVVGKFPAVNLPANVGIRINGLNKNWTGILYDMEEDKLVRVIGISGDNTGYVTLSSSRPHKFFIGNVLVADNPEIKIILWNIGSQSIEFEVHNPFYKKTVVNISSPLFGNIAQRVSLRPGETRFLKIKIKNIQKREVS